MRLPLTIPWLTDFLSTVVFPTLTSSQVEMLEAPISTDDIEEAMSHLAPSKAPGSDGPPLNFTQVLVRP